MEGTEGDLTNRQQGTEALSPTTCEELNPANNHLSQLGSRSIMDWIVFPLNVYGEALPAKVLVHEDVASRR